MGELSAAGRARVGEWLRLRGEEARARAAARLAAWKPGTCVMCGGPFPHPAPDVTGDGTCGLCGAPVVTGSSGGSYHADSRDGVHCLTVHPRERAPEPEPEATPAEQPAYAQDSLFEAVGRG